MTPSNDHLMHLQYIHKTILEFFNDPDKSLYCGMRIIAFMEDEIKQYEQAMEEDMK
jgi:hypothetical protein